MGYSDSLKKAWGALNVKQIPGKTSVKFLTDTYEINTLNRSIVSMSCNVEPKDYYKIIILHYLINEDRVLGLGDDDWMSFKEMDGGEVYFPAFRKRAIEPIIRKYGENPELIFKRIDVLGAEKIDMGNAAISIRIFPKIRVSIVLWAKDEEFPSECNMLFNRSARDILPTEDAAVLGGIIASLV